MDWFWDAIIRVESKSDVITSSPVYDSVLLHFSAKDIARERTLIDRGMLIRLDYREIVNALRDYTLCAEQVKSIILFYLFKFNLNREISKCSTMLLPAYH